MYWRTPTEGTPWDSGMIQKGCLFLCWSKHYLCCQLHFLSPPFWFSCWFIFILGLLLYMQKSPKISTPLSKTKELVKLAIVPRSKTVGFRAEFYKKGSPINWRPVYVNDLLPQVDYVGAFQELWNSVPLRAALPEKYRQPAPLKFAALANTWYYISKTFKKY